MTSTVALARKKVVVLAASICIYSFLLIMLPPAAVRHGMHTVWIVVPLCLLQVGAFVFLLRAFKDLVLLKRAGGRDGIE